MPDAASPPTCPCGHDRDHPAVRARLTYSFWAWLWLLTGASATPRALVHYCTRCHQEIETVRDAATLRHYRK